MKQTLQRLFVYMAAATGDELAQQNQYLKIENAILRAKLPRRIAVTAQERNRLLKYGRLVGVAIVQLISIVTPRTFQRWLQAEKEDQPKQTRETKAGRPKTDDEIRDLVLRLAGETGWGYLRIHGELKKLGVKVSRSTVVNILRESGIDPAPQCKQGTWSDFIQRHAATLWACDFFTQKVWTLGGMVDYYVLFFIHLGTREVIVTGMTSQPDAAWVAQQARNFVLLTEDQPAAPRHLIRDLDTKFTAEFDARMEAEGIEVVPVGPEAPNLNAYAERWVLSLREECLNSFMVFGEGHLQHIISSYVSYYNTVRPHQGIGNVPIPGGTEDPPSEGAVVCQEWLGGVLKHYYRQQAA